MALLSSVGERQETVLSQRQSALHEASVNVMEDTKAVFAKMEASSSAAARLMFSKE